MSNDALIAKLERATEGSRELDRLIGDAIGADMGMSGDAVGLGYPRYTTSLDAAITLVPEGLSASATRHADGSGAAEIWRFASERFADIPNGYSSEDLKRRNGSFMHQNVGAATPALALCIAALRARSAQ